MSASAQATAPARAGAAGTGAGARATVTPAAVAKGALRRLAQAQREPTPEHYAAAYAEEAALLDAAVAAPSPGAAAPAGAAVAPPRAAAPDAASSAHAPAAGGDTAAEAVAAWPRLIDRLVRQLDRGGRQWTAARRKDSVQRVLAGSGGDALRLQQRLQALMTAWEADAPGAATLAVSDAPADAAPPGGRTGDAAAVVAGTPVPGFAAAPDAAASPPSRVAGALSAAGPVTGGATDWSTAVEELSDTLRAGLSPGPAAARDLAQRLAEGGRGSRARGAPAVDLEALRRDCGEARVLFGQQHRVVGELAALCLALTDGMAELAEDGSWTHGQCEAVRACLRSDDGDGDDGDGDGEGGDRRGSAAPHPAAMDAAAPSAPAASPSVPAPPSTPAASPSVPAPPVAATRRRGARVPSERALRAAGARLAQARRQHGRVRQERDAARDALKVLLQDMLHDVVELDAQTGEFHAATAAHAEAIARADSLDGLAGVVRSMLAGSQAVREAVGRSRERLQGGHAHARTLEGRVRELENELRRLSDEASTDALTQLANRRGLARAFEVESRRAVDGGGAALAVALIDIDNFKRLNDTLGHAAGDVALQRLAHEVRERLRPGDHLARFGGEEFVVLLPDTPLPEAEQALTRLQRGLTEALFLHDGREVFVTFSAGVTAWRAGEPMDVALERADRALYEAKRSGKNRTCSA